MAGTREPGTQHCHGDGYLQRPAQINERSASVVPMPWRGSDERIWFRILDASVSWVVFSARVRSGNAGFARQTAAPPGYRIDAAVFSVVAFESNSQVEIQPSSISQDSLEPIGQRHRR
jgi:hypothetical protein